MLGGLVEGCWRRHAKRAEDERAAEALRYEDCEVARISFDEPMDGHEADGIGYLDVDIEGRESAVPSSADSGRFRIGVIGVEIQRPQSTLAIKMTVVHLSFGGWR
jgi:hypothetical protein